MILYNDFDPFNKIEWVACDTETFTYIDGEKVSNDNLLELGKTKPAKFFREHATVRVWAWQISDGEHFFVTNDFDEFIAFFGEHKIKAAWFYNAKFDFAQIDYKILVEYKNKWQQHKRKDENSNAYNKAQPWTYESLHSAEGARYSYKLWVPYRDPVNRHKHVHACDYRDFMKILPGGLERLLNELDVEDLEGNKIRKLKNTKQKNC